MRPVVGLLLLALLVSPLTACQDLFDFPTIEDGVSPPPTEEELGFLQKAKSQEQAGDLNGAAATYRRALQALASFARRAPELMRLHQPTLLIGGEQDRCTPPEALQALARSREDAP